MGEFWGLLPAGLVQGPRLCCPQGGDRGTCGSLLSCDPRGRSKTNALNISQKMIEMFVRTKHKIDKCHEFALVVVNNDATWVSGAVGSGRGWGHLHAPLTPAPLSSQGSPRTPARSAAASMTWRRSSASRSVSRCLWGWDGVGGRTTGGPLGANRVPQAHPGPAVPVTCRWQRLCGCAGVPRNPSGVSVFEAGGSDGAGCDTSPPRPTKPLFIGVSSPPWCWGVGSALCAGIGPYLRLQIWRVSST